MKKTPLLVLFLIVISKLCYAEPGFGISAPFTLDTQDPIVQITSPTLGNELLYGDLLPITWNSIETNISPNCTNLYWRPDPATSWGMISQNEPDDGLFDWPILECGTETAQIQISIRDAFGNLGYGTSDPFIILQPDEAQEVTVYSNPAGAQVFIDGMYHGTTPYATTINPGESFTVTVQKLGYCFSPNSQLVQWMDTPITVNFTGTFTNPGTVITPFNIPDVWVIEDSPYNIVDSIAIASNRNIIMNAGVVVLSYTPASLPVYGSLNANAVTFSSVLDSLYWGGMEFIDTDSTRTVSNINNCTIINATTPLKISNSSPIINTLAIALADTIATMSNIGIQINGTSLPNISNVLISNYTTGIHLIANQLAGQGSPTMSNIRIRNTSSSIRNSRFPIDANPHGIIVTGNCSASLTNIEIENYLTGIKIENNLQTTASPTMSNIRIRNTNSSIRTASRGIVLSGYQQTVIDDGQIYNYNLGIVISTDNPTLGSSPTMANIRIRNTSSSLREASIGIFAGEATSPTIDSCEIWEADSGVVAMANSQPHLVNNIVRNCKTGFRSFSSLLPVLHKNLFMVEQDWANSHPELSFTALDISANPNFQAQNNTFFGYRTVLKLSNSSCMFENNIAWDNAMLTAPFIRINSNLTVAYSDVFAGPEALTGITQINNINENPMFTNVAENNFHLHFNSPCIDSGNPSTANDSDSTRADMGAYPYLHKADFQLPESPILTNLNVTFVNSSIGHNEPISIAQWDLISFDGIESNERNWTTAFATASTYNLQLTMITGNLIDHSAVYQFSVLTGDDLGIPGNPSVHLNAAQLTLSWDAVSGAQRYKILVSDNPYGLFVELDGSQGSFGNLGNRITWTSDLPGAARTFFRIVSCDP